MTKTKFIEKAKKADGKNINNMATMYTRRIEEMKAEAIAEAEKQAKEKQRRNNGICELFGRNLP